MFSSSKLRFKRGLPDGTSLFFYCNVIDVQLSNDREEERFSCLALHDWSKESVLILIEGVAEIILAFIIAFVSTSF